MKIIIVLVAVGIGLLAGGFYYNLFDDILLDFISSYIRDTSDPYYVGAQLWWDAVPYVMYFFGLLSFIMAGIRYRSTTVIGGN